MRLTTRLSVLAGAALAMTACGVNETPDASESKIVGGTAVGKGQADARRWSTVALTTALTKPGSTKKPLVDRNMSFCSGTIIGKRVIVTAAHCIQKFDPKTKKKLPGYTLPKPSDFLISFDTKVSKGGKNIAAAKIIPHPNWNVGETLAPSPSSPPNDIGIIILSADIPASAKPVKIADASFALKKGDSVHLAGFGVTRSRNKPDTGTLRQVKTAYKSTDGKAKRITVGKFFKGACAGDSGGPMYITVNGKLQLAGATSTGAELFGMCLGSINNYTDVRQYLSWIRKAAK